MNLAQILAKEEKAGYTDSAVFGGFANWLANWASTNQQPQLATLAAEYRQAPLQQRPALLVAIRAETVGQAEQATRLNPPQQAGSASLALPLTALPLVGERRAALFAKLGVHTLADLLCYYPRTYADHRLITPIAALKIGEQAQIQGVIMGTELSRPKPRLSIFRVWLRDASGIIAAHWFNQPFLAKQLREGQTLFVSGKLEKKFQQPQFAVQEHQLLRAGNAAAARIEPVYRASEGLPAKTIRRIIEQAWPRYAGLIEETLPASLLRERGLLARDEALRQIHFPADFAALTAARKRLAYEELLVLQAAYLQAGGVGEPLPGVAHQPLPGLLAELQAQLPYALTAAQERVIGEIFADMDAPTAMSRLVQGDVGCGKTMVAAAAVLKCCRSGHQAVLMAPTEILARQHLASLAPLLERLGVPVELLTGSLGAAEKRRIYALAAAGQAGLFIGTQALLNESLQFASLGLAVTDEQHRFGVLQRARLRGRGAPDILVMTATPIPRTLALTLYADLALSIIDELPPGRRPVETYAVGYAYEERIHNFLRKQVGEGRQGFIVCPLIAETEHSDLVGAEELFQRLQTHVFADLRLGLLHGRLKAAAKEQVMADFATGELQILVATTVVEVGVNIPNASVMVVRDAERFGLAQLHQLRGRIGRGAAQSYCVLLHRAESEQAQARMRTLVENQDGFALAEADLLLRGPGEFYGLRQHGLPALKIADLAADAPLLPQSRQDAQALLEGALPLTAPLAEEIEKRLRILQQG